MPRSLPSSPAWRMQVAALRGRYQRMGERDFARWLLERHGLNMSLANPRVETEPESAKPDAVEVVIRQPDSPLHDIGTIVCLVAGCDFESEIKLDVQRHVASAHPKCEPCGSRYFDVEMLAEHQAVCLAYKESLIPEEPQPVVPVFGPHVAGIVYEEAREVPPPVFESGELDFKITGSVHIQSRSLSLDLQADQTPVWEFSRLVDLLVTWENEWRDG